MGAESNHVWPPAALLHARAVTELDGGKRVGDVIYMHVSLVADQATPVQELIAEASAIAGLEAAEFSVVRISREQPEVALLHYPNFFDEPFPALRTSWLVDLEAKRASRRDFADQANALILHRKELGPVMAWG